MWRKRIRGNMKNKIFIVGGLLLITAALLLTMSNVMESQRAGKTASDMLIQIERIEASRADENVQTGENTGAETMQSEPAETQADADEVMPVLSVDGLDCIGTLEIPDLELTLPILNDWSYELLKSAPCRYSGSIQDNNLVIAGHNYRTHFQKIKWMKAGQQVTFSDLNGNEYRYEVISVDEIDGDDVDGMLAGDWDLTLFTCTTSRVARAAVRCRRIS